MTKKEQQRLDRQLEDIADKMLVKGWGDCYDIASDYYRRMLVILRDKVDEQLKRFKNKG